MNEKTIKTLIAACIGILFVGIISFCVWYSIIRLQPSVSSSYVLTCIQGEEQTNLLLNIAKLEGKVDVLQKMIPTFARDWFYH